MVQLVVVGDQSSGKSSLLEGLTGIKFPVATELCTRFATQIVLRRTNEEEVQVRATIIPSDDNDEEIIEYLESFEIELPESSFTAERFKGILDQVCKSPTSPYKPFFPRCHKTDSVHPSIGRTSHGHKRRAQCTHAN